MERTNELIKVSVYATNKASRPCFERIISSSADGFPFDTIRAAMRALFGDLCVIQFVLG